MSNRGTNSGPGTFGIALRCPRCKLGISGLECRQCGFQIRLLDGVLHALPPERAVHHARLLEEYERKRRIEFDGDRTDKFYLGLPYCEASRKEAARWAIKARSFDCVLREILKPRLPLRARILDLGAGNCWLSYRLALAGYSPCAIDLITNDLDGLGAGERYRKYLPEFFPRFRAELSYLPFRDNQFHATIFNAPFLCSTDFDAALQEALRCCRPGGIVIICNGPSLFGTGSADAGTGKHPQSIHGLDDPATFHHGGESLTHESLRSLHNRLHVHWSVVTPKLALGAAIRSWMARARHRPEPALFRIYIARKSP